MATRFADTGGYTENIRPGFVADFLSREHVLAGGVKVDPNSFTDVPDATEVTMDAAALKEATSLTVVALTKRLLSGTVLNFGTRTAVVATVGAAGASATDTSIPVAALSGPIPSGTTLHFGTNKYATLSAAAATGATSLTVLAIPTNLVENDVATYSDQTTVEARLTATAEVGATTLTVAALDDEIADEAVAYYRPKGVTKRVPAGTPVYCAISDFEGSALGGTDECLWKYAGGGTAVNATTDMVRILAYDITDVDDDNDADLLRKSTLVKVNRMYWDELDTTVQAHIRADYEVTVGAPGQEVAPAS